MKKIILFCFVLICTTSFVQAKAVKLGRGGTNSAMWQSALKSGEKMAELAKECDTNCQKCDTSTGRCLSCVSERYLSNGLCQLCPSKHSCDGVQAIPNCSGVQCIEGTSPVANATGCCCV